MNKPLEVNGMSILIFRICLSGIFISAGFTHLIEPAIVADRIHAASFKDFAEFFGDPYWMVVASGLVLLMGGIALMLGISTRWSAAALFLVLIPITITVQLGNGIMHGPLWKNIALFGGLVFFIINNPVVYSIYNKNYKKK